MTPQDILKLCIGVLAVLLLLACSTTTEPESTQVREPTSDSGSTAALLDLAQRSDEPLASEYRLAASELLLAENRIDQVEGIVSRVAPALTLPYTLRIRLAVIQAELALAASDPEAAVEWLDGELTERIDQQQPLLQRRVREVRGRALMASDRYRQAAITLIGLSELYPSDEEQFYHDLIWQALENLSPQQLSQLADGAQSYSLRGWVELARTMRGEQFSIAGQIDSIQRWQDVWNRHGAAELLPSQLVALEQVWNGRPRHIALLLPLQDQIGRAIQEGFLAAYYQALESNAAPPQISVFDTSNVTEIRRLYESAVEAGAELIIGPFNKELVRQLNNLTSLPVPTMALNYTDSVQRKSERFYQFGLAPEDEIRQAAARAWNSGYRNAAIVAPDSTDYTRLLQAFTNTWRTLGGNVVSTTRFNREGEYGDAIKQLLAIDASEDRAARLEALLPRNSIEFTPSRRSDIDFIFMMANPRQGRQINPTLAFYFAGDIPVYALSAINDGSNNRLANQDLNGIVFTDTRWVLNTGDSLREQVDQNLRSAQGPIQRLRALGIDSFRLYARLEQLASGQLTKFEGATGSLTMNSRGVIEWIPLIARFADGIAVPFDEPDTLALN